MTIYDIAKKFNINISTVSKALSGSTDIAEKTRIAVREYAESVGYKSRRARAKKGTIALLIGTEELPPEHIARIKEDFRQAAMEDNYFVLVQKITNDFDVAAFLAEKPYKGVFALGVGYNSSVARALRNTQIPAVLLGNQACDNPVLSNIKSDDLLAAGAAVDHLVSLGHSLIAFIGTDRDSIEGAERFAGYFFGLSKNALAYRYDLTYFGDSSEQSGRDAAEYFLSNNKYFTAIVCASQKAAHGFIACMQRAGKFIPEDISLICFEENIPFGIQLTTLAPNTTALGKQSFTALQATMQGYPSQHITVTYTLMNPTATCLEKKTFTAPA